MAQKVPTLPTPTTLIAMSLSSITVEEHAPVFLQRFPVAGKGRAGAREQVFRALAHVRW